MEPQENKAPTEYTFTEAERAALVNLNTQRVMGKVALYDAEIACERAKQQLRDAETAFQAAVSMVATAHEMAGARLSNDMTKLTR
jgi:hypothetical protein